MSQRILLIDDDRFARQVYGDFLTAGGWEVVTAASGEEGLDRLPEGFDVVVTDLLLPGVDGMEVLAGVRRLAPEAGVVVITALDMVDPAVRAIKAGAFDYLVKPVTAEALQLSVRRCLDLRRLLRENADLRNHLSLSQAGSRITGATRRDRVLRRTAEALVGHTAARLALMVELGPEGPPLLLATGGPEQPDPWSLEETVAGVMAELGRGHEVVPVPAPRSETARMGDGIAVALEGGARRTACLLFPSPGEHLDERDLMAMHFLLDHARQAAETAERLESAESLAHVDDLTQLFNGRYLHRLLDRLLGSGEPEEPFSVLFLDLDRFKEVNDTHGHVVGSMLLAEVARVLRASVRETDVAVRYGGDEYVVVLPGAGTEAALSVAERIRERVASRGFLRREGLGLSVTVSIGVATCPDHALDKQHLIDLADQAMYRGKRTTRNAVYLAPSGAADPEPPADAAGQG